MQNLHFLKEIHLQVVHFPLRYLSFTRVHAVADLFRISIDFSASASCNSYESSSRISGTPSHPISTWNLHRLNNLARVTETGRWLLQISLLQMYIWIILGWFPYTATWFGFNGRFSAVGVSAKNLDLVLSWHLLQRLSFQRYSSSRINNQSQGWMDKIQHKLYPKHQNTVIIGYYWNALPRQHVFPFILSIKIHGKKREQHSKPSNHIPVYWLVFFGIRKKMAYYISFIPG